MGFRTAAHRLVLRRRDSARRQGERENAETHYGREQSAENPADHAAILGAGSAAFNDFNSQAVGSRRAARQSVRENGEFVIDRSREKFLLTYVPDGFVRRIRRAGAA